MNSLVCPFCNTAFDLPGVPGRVVCPRCGEAIPAKLLPAVGSGRVASGDRPAPVELAPAISLRRIGTKSAVLLAAVALALLAVWYFTGGKKLDTVPPMPIPLPTRPPMSLPALRYLPPDTQVAITFQSSPLLQYANRAGKKPERVLAELGLPVGVLEGLAKSDIPLDLIDHAAVGIGLTDSPKISIALLLRKPVESQSHFRDALNWRGNADKPGRATIDLPGVPVPLEMHKLDDTTYLFSSDSAALDGMLKPQENAEFLKAGLRESIGKLDPASFAWLATDDQNWAALPAVKLLSGLAKREDLPKRLKGMRALAAGLALRPDLTVVLAVRLADAEAIREFEVKARTNLAGPNTEMTAENEWRTFRVTGVTATDGLPGIQALFDP